MLSPTPHLSSTPMPIHAYPLTSVSSSPSDYHMVECIAFCALASGAHGRENRSICLAGTGSPPLAFPSSVHFPLCFCFPLSLQHCNRTSCHLTGTGFLPRPTLTQPRRLYHQTGMVSNSLLLLRLPGVVVKNQSLMTDRLGPSSGSSLAFPFVCEEQCTLEP